MIYFLQPIEGGPVKIGFTENLDARHKQLEAHYEQPLALLATMDGGRDEERAVHQRFSHLRFGKTEQFRPDADLMAFINRPLLVDANPDAIEAMKPKARKLTVEVKIDRVLASRARVIAMDQGIDPADYLTDALHWRIERDWSNRPKGAGRIKTRYSVVCTPEYKLWMESFREFLGETEVSDVYRRAVRELAEARGFRAPPAL